MNTDFFDRLSQLGIKGRLVITINNSRQDLWAVTVHYTDPQIKESALQHIPPFCLSCPPERLSAEFFATLSNPLKQTGQLLNNLAEYQKGLALAQEKSRMETTKKNASSTTAATAKASPKYEAIMKKVGDLAAKQFFGQALSTLPKETEFPAFAKQIEAKREELKKLMLQKRSGSLFDDLLPESEAPATGPSPSTAPQDEHEQEQESEPDFDTDEQTTSTND